MHEYIATHGQNFVTNSCNVILKQCTIHSIKGVLYVIVKPHHE